MSKTILALLANLAVIAGLMVSPLALAIDVRPIDIPTSQVTPSTSANLDQVATHPHVDPLPVQPSSASPSILAQPAAATEAVAPQAAPSVFLDSAYIKQVDLGTGRHAALVASSPINYRASDGSWQPIDPRFEAAAGGFISRRNSLVIGAAQQQGVLHLANGRNAITWVPQSIMAANDDKHETVVASSLPLDQSTPGTLTQNNRVIVYPHSWTLPDLSTEVTASAGRVEQSLIVAQRPTLSNTLVTKDVVLRLRADLYLMPGAQLYADSAVQQAAFSTDGALQIRDAKGQTIFVLPAARVFEQQNPSNIAAAHYHLTPQADGRWQVDVDTPWSWWSATTYPVVIDPVVQILSGIDSATIAIHETSAGSNTTAPKADVSNATIVGTFVGNRVRGRQQGYIKFLLPTLPPGAQLTQARLVAVPDNTNGTDPTYANYSDQIAKQETYVSAAQADWTYLESITTTASSHYLTQAQLVSPINATIKKPSPTLGITDTFPATFWDVTNIVKGWYTNPATNFGFVLSLKDDAYHYFEDKLSDGNYPTFMVFPPNPTWSNLDHTITGTTEDGAGLGLLITYSAPQLQANQDLSVPVPSVTTGSYRNEYHEYLWPTGISQWNLVAAVSIAEKTPLDLVSNGVITMTSDSSPAHSTPFAGTWLWQPAYLAVNGHQSLPTDLRVDVLPNIPPPPHYNEYFTYTLQTLTAAPSPSLPSPTGTITILINVTSLPVQAQELDLAQNTTVEVRVPYASAGLDATTAQYYELRLFAPETRFASRTNGGMQLIPGPDAFDIEFSVQPGQSGSWLLVASHTQVAANLTAHVTVCQNTDQVVSYPLNGQCVQLQRPPTGLTIGANYQELGKLRLYSPGGFTGDCSTSCTTNPTNSGVAVMPLIGYVGDDVHWVALKSGTVLLNRGGNSLSTTINTRLVKADFSSPTHIVSLPVLRGSFSANPTNGLITPSSLPVYLLVGDPLPPNESSGWNFAIDLASARLQAGGVLTRTIQPTPIDPASNFLFDAGWSIGAAGGPSLQGQINAVNEPITFTVGTLIVTPQFMGYTLEYDPRDADPLSPAVLPAFRQIRMTTAQLAHPANLGGAHVPVQALFFPPGVEVRDETGQLVDLSCGSSGSSCFDLRGPHDAMTRNGPIVDRQYRMPDLIIQDSASTVMFNTANGVHIYSRDHPSAPSDANGVSFSYQAYGGSVRTYQGPCPGTSGPDTTVIVGNANMALPNLGTDNATTGNPPISAAFTLCEDSLRQIRVTFNTGPDTALPVGNTGLFVDYLGGTIDLVPQQPGSYGYTTVQLDLGFRAFDPPVTASTVFAAGQVTIDSRGLFDMQAHAGVQVFAGIGAAGDGHFWVAWSPLDLGFQTQECAPSNFNPADFPVKYLSTNLCKGNELFYGLFTAHMWQGQGWQHKYNWLPDDNATHMTASFQAQITIKAGMILDWTLVKIPPDDLTLFAIKLSFGQFCSNTPCSTYEWGVRGSFTVLGYDVGVYYGFDSGANFILGSDNHVLIDQAGGAQANARLDVASVQAAFPLSITVSPGVPRVMFGLAWTGPSPTFEIVEPGAGGRTLTKTSSYPDVTVTVTPTAQAQQTIIVVKNPRAGNWHVRVNNVSPTTKYQFFHFANHAAPSLTLSSLPGSTIANRASIPLTWTSTISPAGSARISLYYYVSDPNMPVPIQFAGGPIVEHLVLTSTGRYNWNLAGIGPGILVVFARIESNAPALVSSCGNQPYVPTPTLNSCNTMFNSALSLPTAEVYAPGVLSVRDTIAPAPPQDVAARPNDISSVIVRWKPNSEPDVAGYEVICQQGITLQRIVRVSAEIEANSALSETAQVNGMSPTPAQCAVVAYDTSYNLSGPSSVIVVTPTNDVPLPPPPPAYFAVPQWILNGIHLSWTTSFSATGYLLYYEPLRFTNPIGLQANLANSPTGVNDDLTGSYQANEGRSPINVGDVTGASLTGARPGTTYKVWIRPYDADGRLGAPSATQTFRVPHVIYLPIVLRGF